MAKPFQFNLGLLFYLTALGAVFALVGKGVLLAGVDRSDLLLAIAVAMAIGVASTWPRKRRPPVPLRNTEACELARLKHAENLLKLRHVTGEIERLRYDIETMEDSDGSQG